jgi:uncharacterized protein (TIGR03067 family)
MRICSMVCCSALLLCLEMALAQDAGQGEQQKLQGSWQVLRYEYDGNDQNTEDIRLVIAPGQIVIKDKQGDKTIRYTLDAGAKPKTIDLTRTVNGSQLQMTGIYQLDGDTLRICFGEKEQARPTEFSSPKGSRLTLFVLRRVKG